MLDVLLTLKGEEQKEIEGQKIIVPMCESKFPEGEVRLVFLRKGHIAECNGNFGFKYQSDDLRAYLRIAKVKMTKPSRSDMEMLLMEGLKGYLHEKSTIAARYPSLRGETLQIGSSEIQFVGKAKGHAKTVIVIDEAITFHDFVFIKGEYRREGLKFEALLHKLPKGHTVLYSSRIET